MTRRTFVLLALVAGVVLADPPAPRTELAVTVPDCESKQQGDLTEVTVPGGGVLYVEAGRPEVPYFNSWFGYPKNCRIQDVTLKGKSGMKVDSGLQMPLVHFSSYNDPVPDVAPKPGVYPAEDFTWRVVEGIGDSITLAITVYPYRFDPASGVGTSHKQYEFEVRYVLADIGIRSVSHVSPVCDPGDTLRTVVRLTGTWEMAETEDVTMKPMVLDGTTGEAVAEPAELKLGPADSVVVEWPTARRAIGQYIMEFVVSDASGNELDRERASFRIGNPRGEVTGFDVEPQCFKVGDDVELTLDFRNTGSIALSGSCVFRIMKAGEVVDELRREMTSLRPGASKTFRQSWNTAAAEKSVIYDAVGVVKYEGTASEPKSVMFSTNLMPVAVFAAASDTAGVGDVVEFDASASKDEDGSIVEYRWEFDDGGKAPGVTARHAWMQVGEFVVRLSVVDNEDGTGTVTKVVVVEEQ